MKTCRVCGALVDDREWNCPECGATMITSGGSLSLKSEEPTKKKSGNRMGTTVSTGSGLTDILRADSDGDYDDVDDGTVMGSIPMTLSKNIIEEEEQRKKAKANRRLMANIFKAIIVIVILVAAAIFIRDIFFKEDKAKTCDELVKNYVEAVNEQDVDLMLSIVPQFLANRQDEAQALVDGMKGVKLTKYTVKSKEEISRVSMDLLRDEIKLTEGKNANLDEGYYLEVEFVGTNPSGLEETAVVIMEVYRVKDRWFLYPATFDNWVFTD